MQGKTIVEKVGSIGSFLAALACPGCFPMFAVVGSVLGLGFLRPYEGWVFLVFRILVFVALVGNIISYLNHRNNIALTIGLGSPLLIFLSLHIYFHPALMYSGLFGLLIASILNYIYNRQCKTNLKKATQK